MPLVTDRYGYEGAARIPVGPDSDSEFVKTVELSFWKRGTAYSRIELPIDLINIPLLDRTEARMVDGTVCASASDADMIESKVLALFSRITVEPRDLLDLFLFGEKLTHASPRRFQLKMTGMGMSPGDVHKGLKDLSVKRQAMEKRIEEVISKQMEPSAASILMAPQVAAR